MSNFKLLGVCRFLISLTRSELEWDGMKHYAILNARCVVFIRFIFHRWDGCVTLPCFAFHRLYCLSISLDVCICTFVSTGRCKTQFQHSTHIHMCIHSLLVSTLHTQHWTWNWFMFIFQHGTWLHCFSSIFICIFISGLLSISGLHQPYTRWKTSCLIRAWTIISWN